MKARLHESWAAVEVQPRGSVLVFLPPVVVLVLHLLSSTRTKTASLKKGVDRADRKMSVVAQI